MAIKQYQKRSNYGKLIDGAQSHQSYVTEDTLVDEKVFKKHLILTLVLACNLN